MKATAIHSNQTRRASPPDAIAVCRDRRPPMRSSLHASPRKLIITNDQREIPEHANESGRRPRGRFAGAMLDLRNG